MAGGAQAKMSTWFSKPNQSWILKVTKKRVGFNLKIFVFALLMMDVTAHQSLGWYLWQAAATP